MKLNAAKAARITLISEEDLATVMVNPFSFNLQYCEFVVYDVFGKEVMRKNVPNTNSFTIERTNLPDNIYFYNIVSNSKTILTGKLVVTQ